MNTSVTYNRSAKQYEVRNGHLIATFPPGPEGHQAAIQEAIKHEDPRAHAIAFYLACDLYRFNREIQDRIWRAAAIVAKGDVRERYSGDETHVIARIKNQSLANTPQENIHYRIQIYDNRYACHCFDYENTAPTSNGQKLCKHILAVKMMKILNREPIAWPEATDYRELWIRSHSAKKTARENAAYRAEKERRENAAATKAGQLGAYGTAHNRQAATRAMERQIYETAIANADLFAD